MLRLLRMLRMVALVAGMLRFWLRQNSYDFQSTLDYHTITKSRAQHPYIYPPLLSPKRTSILKG